MAKQKTGSRRDFLSHGVQAGAVLGAAVAASPAWSAAPSQRSRPLVIDGMMHLEVYKSRTEGYYWEGFLEEVLEHYEAAKIDKGVILTTWTPSRESNDRTLRAYEKYPDRFIPFGHVRPEDADWQRELKRVSEPPWKGLKLHEGEIERAGDLRETTRTVTRKAAELGIRIFKIHLVNCDIIDELTRELSEVTWILPHMGCYGRWGDMQKYCELAKNRKNVYLDTSAVAHYWMFGKAFRWACQAGKDVYVEKPVSYNIWEGRQMVVAARKHGRIVQAGTQGRSSLPLQQAFEYIQSGQIGPVLYAHAVNYMRRPSIGKVDGPQPVLSTVDYNLWRGPAPMEPLMREDLHYDWHWVWSTGNGEMGNNGVHYIDMCRWALGYDGLAPRAMSIGGRFGYDDDGQTPNTQVAILDYTPAPIICEIRGLPSKTGARSMDKFRTVDKGILIQCEEGYFTGGHVGGAVFDRNGGEIKRFRGVEKFAELAVRHLTNFAETMRSRNREARNADIQEGHISAAGCHMANVSHLLGAQATPQRIMEVTKANSQLADAFERCRDHLRSNGVDIGKTPAVLGPWVTMDSGQQTFVGEFSDRANELSKRVYRKPFVVPEIA
jgi:predicted dehydrogenase